MGIIEIERFDISPPIKMGYILKNNFPLECKILNEINDFNSYCLMLKILFPNLIANKS